MKPTFGRTNLLWTALVYIGAGLLSFAQAGGFDPAGPCTAFAAGPYPNIQQPPTGEACGTPIHSGFQVFGNEAYLLDGQAGTRYELGFCEGYDPVKWEAVITVARYDDRRRRAVPGSVIAWTEGCSLSFMTPADETYIVIIAARHALGGPEISQDNGLLSLTAECPPRKSSTLFHAGPHRMLQAAVREYGCGFTVEPGHEVQGNEAFLFDGLAGIEYAVSFCEGYSEERWPAVITIARYDERAQRVVPNSIVAAGEGCSLSFTALQDGLHIVVINAKGYQREAKVALANGLLTFTPACPEPGPENTCPSAGDLRITDIVSREGGLWLEIYNTTESTLDLSGWTLAGERAFTLEGDLNILPKGYLLLGTAPYYDASVGAEVHYTFPAEALALVPGREVALLAPCRDEARAIDQLVYEEDVEARPQRSPPPAHSRRGSPAATLARSETSPVAVLSSSEPSFLALPEKALNVEKVPTWAIASRHGRPASSVSPDGAETLPVAAFTNPPESMAAVFAEPNEKHQRMAAPKAAKAKLICPTRLVEYDTDGRPGMAVDYAMPVAANFTTEVSISLESGLPSGRNFPAGTTVLRWRAEDKDGRIAYCRTQVTVHAHDLAWADFPLPASANWKKAEREQCPDPIVVGPSRGKSEARVSWLPPHLNAPLPGERLVPNFQPGDRFPLGSTTVRYLRVDALGNTWLHCTFTVTVDEGLEPGLLPPPGQLLTRRQEYLPWKPDFADGPAASTAREDG